MTDPILRLNAALEGRYRIERQLGAGGMATVYLAEDLRHQRRVAIKVLKPELAALVGADRFLAEIRTTANLQHPHILPLFDSGEANGFLYYVMPFVEGESLRDRLDREKQLPVDEAVAIATKVAAGLQAAHDQGIVHRDIKPANILLANGEPLLADFGIALVVRSGDGARLTETGMSLGTPNYMSPEQVTGEGHVGSSTDVYSLACVLFEMLSGQPPFTAPTQQAIVGQILAVDPPSVRSARPTAALNIDHAIRRALEKIPADRFGSVTAFAAALADPVFRVDRTEVEVAGPVRRWSPLTLVFAVATVGLSAALWGALSSTDPAAHVARFDLGPASPGSAAVVSPDGQSVVMRRVDEAGVPRLWLRRLDDLTIVPIAGTEGAGIVRPAVFSPAADQLAFVANDALHVAAPDGTGLRTLTDSVFCCPTWERDGYLYYTAVGRHLARVPIVGGEDEVVTELLGWDGGHFDFRLLPSGDHALFHVGGGNEHLEVLDLASGERTALGPGMRATVAESGHVLYGFNGQILAADFDPAEPTVLGEPVPLVDDVHTSTTPYPRFDLSTNGTLVYSTGDGRVTYQPMWVSRDGSTAPVDPAWTFETGRGSANFGWELSPDGTRVAYGLFSQGIWLKELPNGPAVRLTVEGASDILPHWTPDGSSVTFTSNRSGRYELWSKSADGSGDEGRVAELERDVARGFWGPEGDWLIVRTVGQAGNNQARDVLGIHPETGETIPVAATDATEGNPALSPDGRWIAYSSNVLGTPEIFVRPFPNAADGRWLVSQGGGETPLWSHDGQELFYVQGRELRVARIETESGFRVISDDALFEIPPGYLVSNGGHSYDVTADGQRFLMAAPHASGEGEGSRIVLVQNFLRELERLASR